MGIPDEHMQLGESVYPAKLAVPSLVKDTWNAFFEEHAFQVLPCFRGVKLVDPSSPMIVLCQAWRGGTLADNTNVLGNNQDSVDGVEETTHS